MAERKVMQFTVTVKSKAEDKDGWLLELEIPTFNSKYPTKVNRVAEEVAKQLMPGQTYVVELEQQNLKQGKSGESHYDYYWGLVGVVKEGVAPPSPAPEQPAQAPKGGYRGTDDARSSIEAQVSLKEAVSLVVAKVIKLEEVPKTAGVFYGVLQTLKEETPSQGEQSKAMSPPTPLGSSESRSPQPSKDGPKDRRAVAEWAINLPQPHTTGDIAKVYGGKTMNDIAITETPTMIQAKCRKVWGIQE